MKKATKLITLTFLMVFLSVEITFAQLSKATDQASNYSSWADGDNEGYGFGAWSISTSGGSGGFGGVFLGNPSTNSGISGLPSTSFSMYAHSDAGAFANADRTFNSLTSSDTLKFSIGINWDSNGGNKGINIYSGGTGGTQLVNINNASTDDITINGATMFDNYGTNAIEISVVYISDTNIRVFGTGRDGSESYDDTLSVSSGTPDAIRFYVSGQGSGDNRNFHFNDLEINSSSLFTNITGSEGWRILSTPTSDNTYDDLLGDIWTQGIGTGADVTNGTANVQLFNTTTDNFAAVTDLTTTMTAGTGFITYVYSDDDHTNSGTDAGFPKTLSVDGTENSGSVSPTLNGGTSGDDSFSLVGNPYASTIDWDLLTTTDLTGTVYVYDHSYGSVSAPDVSEAVGGGYRVWTGSTGSLTDGLIAPFQGFWVQNSGGSAALTIEEADKSSGGTFYKKAEVVNFAFKSEIGNMYDETFFSFSANASVELDNNDALQLSPLDYRSYMSLASRSTDDLFDVNNLPTEFDEIQVPVSVKAYEKVENGYGEMEGSAKLTWSDIDRLPESWTLSLSDTETGTTINLREVSEYSFELVGTKSKARVASVLTPLQPTKEKATGNSDRFVLTISQTTSVNNEPGSEVRSFALDQNYPNPFNPTTTINYSVENSGAVTLSVYNLMGQKVAELVNETKSAGSYNVSWNASQAASGMYYYRLEAGGQVLTRKMTLIK